MRAGICWAPVSPMAWPLYNLQELAAKMAHPVISFQEGPSNGGSGSGEQHAEVVRSCRWGAPVGWGRAGSIVVPSRPVTMPSHGSSALLCCRASMMRHAAARRCCGRCGRWQMRSL